MDEVACFSHMTEFNHSTEEDALSIRIYFNLYQKYRL